MSITLTVCHNIYLSKEDRYALHMGEPQEVIGCSVPVWLIGDQSSEPAKEVFCRYYLFNSKKDVPVKILDDGYEIHVPYRIPKSKHPELTDDEWRKLSREEQEQYYLLRGNIVTSQNLLDVADGGAGVLMYREHDKFEYLDKTYNVIHFVNINSFEFLYDSIVTQEDSLSGLERFEE